MLLLLFSAHGRDTVDRCWHVAAGVGRRFAGVLQELEIRTGIGQPAVESGLQRHRDQRHGEQQHVVQDIPGEQRDDRRRYGGGGGGGVGNGFRNVTIKHQIKYLKTKKKKLKLTTGENT